MTPAQHRAHSRRADMQRAGANPLYAALHIEPYRVDVHSLMAFLNAEYAAAKAEEAEAERLIAEAAGVDCIHHEQAKDVAFGMAVAYSRVIMAVAEGRLAGDEHAETTV